MKKGVVTSNRGEKDREGWRWVLKDKDFDRWKYQRRTFQAEGSTLGKVCRRESREYEWEVISDLGGQSSGPTETTYSHEPPAVPQRQVVEALSLPRRRVWDLWQ